MIAALYVALAVETATLTALIHEESGGVVDAVSASGAVGLCQIVPKYSRFTAAELRNPWLNIVACIEAKAYWQGRAYRAGKPRCWRAGWRMGNDGFKECRRKICRRKK